MQIGNTRWYTALIVKQRQIAGRKTPSKEYVRGYRMRLSDMSENEIKDLLESLHSANIQGRMRTSKHDHTDIPAGEPFFQVSEKESIKNLEALFKQSHIDLNPDRFRIGYPQIASKNKGGR